MSASWPGSSRSGGAPGRGTHARPRARCRDRFVTTRLPFGQIECVSVSSCCASFCSWARTGVAGPTTQEPRGDRRLDQLADSGGRDGRRPSHVPCQIQEIAALRRCRGRHCLGRPPRRRHHDDRRERGAARQSPARRAAGSPGREPRRRSSTWWSSSRRTSRSTTTSAPTRTPPTPAGSPSTPRRGHPKVNGLLSPGPPGGGTCSRTTPTAPTRAARPHERQRPAHLRPGPRLHRRATGLQRREDGPVHRDGRHRHRREPDRPGLPGPGRA